MKRFKQTAIAALLACMAVGATSAWAASGAQVDTAIDKGLAYLRIYP